MTKRASDTVPFEDRVAFVTELAVEGKPGRFSGLFAAHWEARSGKAWEEGPTGVDVSEAVAWARRSAAVVSVVVGGRGPVFSAGVRPPTGDSRPWPTEGIEVRERPFGSPPHGGLAEVPWTVESTARAIPSAAEAAAASVKAVFEDSPNVLDVSVVTLSGVMTVRCCYRARDMNASTLEVDALMEQALRSTFPSLAAVEILDITTSTLGPSSGG